MKAYETSGTVGADGALKIEAPQELANQEVEVLITPKRPPAAERVAAWERLCRRVQGLAQIQRITDEDIEKEINAGRGG